MTMTAIPTDNQVESRILDAVKRYWGYDELRPLQGEAIAAGIEHRDSLVVLPTGGGKSLCYQVPPLLSDRMDVVVSPLISLMKDQVDGLRQNGYPAAAVHSNLTPMERAEIRDGMNDGVYKLLFVSPERLITPRFMKYLVKREVKAFAIDEAHCISHWGHDFRPEYRQLASLKQRFPQASVHAYTATATTRVQRDIVAQLNLEDAAMLVGRFDRPNLVYRVLPSVDVYGQMLQVIKRHAGEAVIVYCITRKDTEAFAEFFRANGVNAAAYHAGMDKEQRSETQEAFAEERLDVVVATVAFGMGIDRSNVRCVIHAAMPKSIEHYQQETGRAGRDGLEAECVLFYSAADAIRWERIFSLSALKADESDEETSAAQLALLHHMQGLCGTLECRHSALTRYFGQVYEDESCGACDVCLDEVDSMPDSTMVAQKILSCVYRTGQSFGVKYIVDVLRGANTEQVRRRGHDELSTHGLLAELPEKTMTNLVYQLIDQRLISRTSGDRPTLQLNDGSMAVLRGEREVRMVEPATGPVRKTRVAEVSWEGVDEGLFEHLRELRREIARERKIPSYVIFGDATLRELARLRPASVHTIANVRGVGEKKLADHGLRFTEAIKEYCEQHCLDVDVVGVVRTDRVKRRQPSAEKNEAMKMFSQQASIADVARATGRAVKTVWGYLAEFIAKEHPESIESWIPDTVRDRVDDATRELASDGRLRPIFDYLEGEVPYEVIRAVIAYQKTRDS